MLLEMGLTYGGTRVPWNGRADVLIDRYDARTLLDVLPQPLPAPPGTDERERELEALCNFERYKALVAHASTGAPPAELIGATVAARYRGHGGAAATPTQLELAAPPATAVRPHHHSHSYSQQLP